MELNVDYYFKKDGVELDYPSLNSIAENEGISPYYVALLKDGKIDSYQGYTCHTRWNKKDLKGCIEDAIKQLDMAIKFHGDEYELSLIKEDLEKVTVGIL